MSHCIRFPGGHGMIPIVRRGEMGLNLVSFSLLFLEPGESFSEDTGEDETALVILGGSCDASAGENRWENLGARADVFDGAATCVYVPRESNYGVTARDGVEIAVCRTAARRNSAPHLVRPEHVPVIPRGRDNWSRTVHDVVDARVDADRMLVGETFSPPGNWSSSPPHRHEKDDLPRETRHEEIYYFRVRPRQGFGIIRLYNDDRSLDETITVGHNDTVVITGGYHPTVAGPGYSLYYLWVLAGKERRVVTRDDPNHAWLKEKG
ncbi:MAG: 5-deoxy-glucuronate isomerase [bacterium]